MSKFRSVNTHFWDDTYVVDLDPIEKLLFLYLLTNPLTDICGAYEINLRRIALDTGIDREMILKMLERFAAADKITYRDGWILIHNFVKNQVANPSVMAGVARSLNDCPDWVRDTLLQSGDRLPESVVLNLTKPNLTKPSAGDFSRGIPINPLAQEELDGWLDAVAVATGAASRTTLADFRKWEKVCMQAITEKRKLPDFVTAIKKHIETNRGKLQYFSPDGVLKQMQLAEAQPARKKFDVDLSGL